MKHGYYPSVWLHPNDKNILIIASYIENCMESYDVRMIGHVKRVHLLIVPFVK